MKIKIDIEINNCKECLFILWNYEHGLTEYTCKKVGSIIDNYTKIPQWCPFLKEDYNK